MAQMPCRHVGNVTQVGLLTLADCAEHARTSYSGVSELLGAGPLPTDFPDVDYVVVDHGEWLKGELPPGPVNPFRTEEAARQALETAPRPAPSLGGRIDVWSERHPARKAGEVPWLWEDEPERVLWHASHRVSASCRNTRAEAVADQVASLSFGAMFWVEKLRWHRRGDRHDDGCPVARIAGQHYVLGSGTGPMRGMAGRPIGVRFHDGTETVCRDLWYQGAIPEELLHLLPDNAELFTPERTNR